MGVQVKLEPPCPCGRSDLMEAHHRQVLHAHVPAVRHNPSINDFKSVSTATLALATQETMI